MEVDAKPSAEQQPQQEQAAAAAGDAAKSGQAGADSALPVDSAELHVIPTPLFPS